MQHQFSEPAPGGTVSGRKTVRRQARGLVYEYDLRSTATDRVAVHLADRVPTDVAEDFGFHREHEPVSWSLSDDELAMTVELEPGADRTVVLGIAAEEVDLPDDHAAAPLEVEVAVEVGDAGDLAAEEDGPAVTAPDDGGAALRGPRVDADGGLVDAAQGATGGVVSRLVDELEADAVPESELDALRAHLGTERDDEAARLEAVADEVAALRRRQDELADRVDDLAAAQGAHADAVEALEVAHEEDVAAVRSDVERHEAAVGDELAALRQDLEADLAALEADIDAFEATRRALIDGFRGAGDGDDSPPDDADDAATDDPPRDSNATDDVATDSNATDDAATDDATDAADLGAAEERDEDAPVDDVFIPPSRLDEVSADADADDPLEED